jgi:G:T/U-mismatch repair DNA glycosylase
MQIEQHPLQPFLPSKARLLMLGSFPPQRKRWSMDFYYPNWNNDMWRIMGLLFFADKDYFCDNIHKAFRKECLVHFLTEQGIALYDTATEVRRLQDNASDKFLQVEEAIDIHTMIDKLPTCVAIATTGEKAASVLASITASELPKVGSYVELHFSGGRVLRHYRMPSSSRAYPMKVEKKAEYYRQMLRELGII